MPRHVIVDGSNLATEGRSKPSLKQLNEAVMAYMADNPKDVVTVIVDATFGHRIERKEVAEFDEAVANNELVAPPAGTVGRGDAFVLMLAKKVGATVLSNDSYQEFHSEHRWLFDEGRLIGGKPVPNIGWVFVPRTPVRGEKSRRSEAKSAKRAKSSVAVMKPMPVPKSPPPGAVLAKKKAKSSDAPVARSVNEILPFLHFVEHHPVGSVVKGKVESYAAHGAYVDLGDVRGYVPLRLLGDPPPRAARDVFTIGQEVSLEIASVVASRRSIDLKLSAKSSGRGGARATAKKAPAKSSAAKKSSGSSPAAKTVKKKTTSTTSPAKTKTKTTTKATIKRATAKKATAKKSAVTKSTSRTSPAAAKSASPPKRNGNGRAGSSRRPTAKR